MNRVSNFIIITVAVIAVLVIAKGILIPFVFALIFWFLTREVSKTIYKIPFAKRYLPLWLSNVFVFTGIILVIGFISGIISDSIKELTSSYSRYEQNVYGVVAILSDFFDTDMIKAIQVGFAKFNYGSLLQKIANSLSDLLGNTFMIVLYALFLFLEESSLMKRIRKVFKTKEGYESYQLISSRIEGSISNYLRLKTLLSVLTGVLSYIVLLIVGVDSAPFWAFLIFILNYIPTIGSLFGTLFPAAFSLLQFGEFQPFLIVLIAVGAIQVLVGNVLEPRLFGKSLNLSPLVTIIGLAIWGKIWGITGMILSVPITVIIIIICSKFETSQKIAVLLSENGDIEES